MTQLAIDLLLNLQNHKPQETLVLKVGHEITRWKSESRFGLLTKFPSCLSLVLIIMLWSLCDLVIQSCQWLLKPGGEANFPKHAASPKDKQRWAAGWYLLVFYWFLAGQKFINLENAMRNQWKVNEIWRYMKKQEVQKPSQISCLPKTICHSLLFINLFFAVTVC